MINEKQPSARIELTTEETERLNSIINEKGLLDPPCEFCGKKEFLTSPVLVYPPNLVILKNNEIARGPQQGLMPLATVTCGNCGNTKFFNTMILGFKPGAENE